MVDILASIFIILVTFVEDSVHDLKGVLFIGRLKNVFLAVNAASLLALSLVVVLYTLEGFMFLVTILGFVKKLDSPNHCFIPFWL